MAKSNSLLSWFKKNILRMGDTTEPSVDLSREEEVVNSPENMFIEEQPPVSDFEKPKSVKLINQNLTVVMEDGKIYSKSNSGVLDYEKVKSATSQKEINEVFFSPEKVQQVEEIKKENMVIAKKKEEIKSIISNLDILSSYEKTFLVVDNTVYLNKEGMTHRSIPQLLIKKFVTVINGINKSEDLMLSDTYKGTLNSLIRFWEKCCLCPNAQSAEDLYGFLERHKFKIDEHGNFYTYRRVVRIKENSTKVEQDLVDFVSNAYNKVKAVWKKKAANFDVYKNGKDFKLIDLKKVTGEIKATKVGNLEELYTSSLSSMPGNRFTDDRTKKEDYRVGNVISMPRDKGDSDNNTSCSTGYHVASKAYDYSSFGDTPILAIVNPIDVLSVPKGEIGKMRVCRWFFAMTLDLKEEHILDDDRFDVRHLGDVFESKCLENLSEHIKKIYAEEVKKHKFNLPEMDDKQIEVVVKSLEDIKNELRNRIQKAV